METPQLNKIVSHRTWNSILLPSTDSCLFNDVVSNIRAYDEITRRLYTTNSTRFWVGKSLIMESVSSSETSVNIYHTIRRYISKDTSAYSIYIQFQYFPFHQNRPNLKNTEHGHIPEASKKILTTIRVRNHILKTSDPKHAIFFKIMSLYNEYILTVHKTSSVNFKHTYCTACTENSK